MNHPPNRAATLGQLVDALGKIEMHLAAMTNDESPGPRRADPPKDSLRGLFERADGLVCDLMASGVPLAQIVTVARLAETIAAAELAKEGRS